VITIGLLFHSISDRTLLGLLLLFIHLLPYWTYLTMSVTVETQRLISVSLGKIAQSRGQRGGINLHKNLLVATVLHKARAAYMIETFNYQQQHQISMQQQKAHDEQMLRLQQQQQQQPHVVDLQHQEPACPVVEQECSVSCESEVENVDLGQCCLASAAMESQSTAQESQSFVSSAPLCAESSPEPLVCGECEQVALPEPEPQECQCDYVTPENSLCQEIELSVDKENSVPVPEVASTTTNSQCPLNESVSSEFSHLEAANRLSQDASLGLNSGNYSSCQLENTSVSGSTTCSGILKRRRDNNNVQSDECTPVSKKSKTIHESSIAKSSAFFASFTSEASDYSSEGSDTDSDCDTCECSVPVPMNTDTHQISNLVNIFNSGFSGLCAGELTSSADSEYDCDFESTAPPQYTTLTQLRSDSPSQSKASFTRSISEPSLLCSTEVGRLDSLQSTIVLSA